MYAVGFACQGDVDPVVDEEASAVTVRDLAEAAGQLEKGSAGEVLLSQLYRIDAAGERCLDDVEQRPASGALAIGDEVEPERIVIRARGSCSA